MRTERVADPDPEDIAEAARRIREGWSPAEADRRWRGPRPTPWSVPEIPGQHEHGEEDEGGN